MTTMRAGTAAVAGLYQAFLFDLDGTLIDSEVVWVEAVGRALAAQGAPVDTNTVLALVYGHAWSDIWRVVAERWPQAFESAEQMLGVTRAEFMALRPERDLRIASSIDLLRALATTSPVAVVSGSACADVARELAAAGILECVRFYLGNEDCSPGKPDPACYLLAAERLGIPAARCLVFEDSAAGVRAAKAAGMGCVALCRPDRPVQDVTQADWIVHDLAVCRNSSFLGSGPSGSPDGVP